MGVIHAIDHVCVCACCMMYFRPYKVSLYMYYTYCSYVCRVGRLILIGIDCFVVLNSNVLLYTVQSH